MGALIVAMVVAVELGEPTLATVFTDILFLRISPAMRRMLGVPEPPHPLTAKRYKALYRTVRTRLHGLLALMDPSWLPKNRRLDPAAFEAEAARRHVRLTEDEWAERERRLVWFVNQLLEASHRALPREFRDRWDGSVAVDATPVAAYARPFRQTKRRAKTAPREVLVTSSDPDADWYGRKHDHRDEDGSTSSDHYLYGYELTMVVSGSDDPTRPQGFPTLVEAMAMLHRPGHEPGTNAIKALQVIAGRGDPTNFVAGDRAYPNSKPQEFQLPARALGYRPVFDYKGVQLGVQSEYRGMLQVDGAWYCPAIPKVLIDATADFDDGRIDEPTYRARLEERWRYRVLPKAGVDADGHLRVRCPASSPTSMAGCDLKPKSVGPKTRGRLRVMVPTDLAARPPAICTQQSVMMPPEAGAKFAQDLLYGSDEHRRTYATLRNSIEGMNGYLKDGANEALDDPERRRIRGVAAQTLFVGLSAYAGNLRKIDAFLRAQEVVDAESVRRLPRRRRTKPIQQWLPNESTSEPDPPLTA